MTLCQTRVLVFVQTCCWVCVNGIPLLRCIARTCSRCCRFWSMDLRMWTETLLTLRGWTLSMAVFLRSRLLLRTRISTRLLMRALTGRRSAWTWSLLQKRCILVGVVRLWAMLLLSCAGSCKPLLLQRMGAGLR